MVDFSRKTIRGSSGAGGVFGLSIRFIYERDLFFFSCALGQFPTWPYGLAACKVSEAAKDVSIGVSVFTLIALSADRYFAIVDPLRKLHTSVGGRFATRFTVSVAAAIWVAALACAAPAARYSYVRQFRHHNVTLFEACYPFPEHLGPAYPKLAVLVKFLVYYAVPLAVIACFYVLIARYLVRTTNNMPGELQVSGAGVPNLVYTDRS